MFGKGIFVATLVMGMAASALADDPATISVVLKDHKFTPSEIRVKADTPVVISLSNQDSAAEEFDSIALKVEKVVTGNSEGVVRIRPLSPGRYPFMGEYHSATAQGVVVVQ